MTIDPGMVARRRHTARTLVRLAALVLIGWSCTRLLNLAWAMFGLGGGRIDVNDLFRVGSLVMLLLLWSPVPLSAALLLIFERRLVAWLVPAPRANRCPACDYDLRYLTQDRCPECGLPIAGRG